MRPQTPARAHGRWLALTVLFLAVGLGRAVAQPISDLRPSVACLGSVPTHTFVVSGEEPSATPASELVWETLAPPAGRWIIKGDCTVRSDTVVHGDIVIVDRASLRIMSGATLDAPLSRHSVTVEPGARLIVEAGASIR